jgi:branched-subunit amino acid transport protein AzlD
MEQATSEIFLLTVPLVSKIYPSHSRVILPVRVVWWAGFPSLPHLTTDSTHQPEWVSSLGFLPCKHAQLLLCTCFKTFVEEFQKSVGGIEKFLDFLINGWKRWREV